MTLLTLARRGLIHYRRTHVAVALGVAAAVAVLAGSFLVGASVQSSLAALTSRRLGRTAVVVGSETLFPESLAARLGAQLANDPAAAAPPAPLLAMNGLISHERSRQRANGVMVYGVDARFFAFHGVAGPAPGEGDVMLSPDLSDELGAGGDDVVVLRVAKPTDVPLDSLHAARDDAGRSVRLRYVGPLAREAMGEFSLSPDQGVVRAAFVHLSRLQQDLDQAGQINTVLVARDLAGAPNPSDVRTALTAVIEADDLGLRFTADLAREAVIVESRAGLIPDRLASATTIAAARASLPATSVLSWLATRLEVGDRVAPYSLVTAIGPDAGGDPVLASLLATPPVIGAAPIVLNDWAARDLRAVPGDTLSLEYYRWADEGRLVTGKAAFRVAGVVPMTGVASDRRLAPEYPGITDASSLVDWTPPFPVDLRLVRPVDEDYWDKHRATPKAFIPLASGQLLWRTRYGQVTSIRMRTGNGPGQPGPDAVAAELASAVARGVDPLGGGFGVVDVRRQNVAASAGATDFGVYFSYFSFFLVVSAALLAALFFRLSIEQRLSEIGLLRAAGFTLATVRRLFLLESGLVTAAGAVIGAGLAVLWAAVMMYGLRTWWVGAVGTTDLELHVDGRSLALGMVMGAAAGLGSMTMSVRQLSRYSPRALITGVTDAGPAGRTTRAGSVALASLVLAIGLPALSSAGLIPDAAAFFGAGASALVAGLAALRWQLTGRGAVISLGQRGTAGLLRLALRNAAWRPGRSLTSTALVASAVFLLVSVDAFRKGPDGATGPQSGTGGFALMGETTLPFADDPSTPAGRDALGAAFGANDQDLAGVSITAARLRPGEDASCLNLYQPKQPRVMSISPALVEANRFRFQTSLAATDAERANPWRLLGPAGANGVVPAIVDATSLQYVLHAAVGDEITIDVETARPVTLKVVASLADSMLQGEILVAQEAFLDLYPEQAGYRVMLVEVAPESAERLSAVTALLEDRLDSYGLDLESGARRLEAFHRVENTYLSTFQTLGGLGLVLGSLGLIAIIARNVLERRRELAVLGAAGFTARSLQMLVLAEHMALVVAGLVVGGGAAGLATAPLWLTRGGALPRPMLWLAVVAVTGVVASVAATRGVRRLPLVPSLRGE